MARVASLRAESVSTYSAFQQRFLKRQATHTSSAARSKMRAMFSSLACPVTFLRTVSKSSPYASLSLRSRDASKRLRPDSPQPRSMHCSTTPTRFKSEDGRIMKMTEAQKVSNSALTGCTLPQAQTVARAPASTKLST